MKEIELFNSIVRNRKSTNPSLYNGKVIEKSIIEEILTNANTAPTHKITQPWRFTVYTGNGLKTLAQQQADLYKEETPKEQFLDAKYQKLLSNPLQCSHIIVIGMKKSDNGIPEIEEIEAVACAVQNMYLSCSAYGISCLWGTGGITYMESAKKLFGLDKTDKLLGFFYLGYSDKDTLSPTKKDVTNFTSWVE